MNKIRTVAELIERMRKETVKADRISLERIFSEQLIHPLTVSIGDRQKGYPRLFLH